MRGGRDIFARQAAWTCCQCILAAALLGCGSSSVKTYSVKGKVDVKDGEVSLLAGSHVELMQENEPEIRPNGKIEPGGGFSVQTQHQGKIVAGAPAGKYKVRIVLADASEEGVPKRKGDPIHKRFFDFETSGLSITVPSGHYTISVSKK